MWRLRLPRRPRLLNNIPHRSRPLLLRPASTNSFALPKRWFESSTPTTGAPGSGDPDHKPVDERTVNLGRTIRTLQQRLPTLLQSPLPTDILSPSITLHLFPSTHPSLPTVRGRVAYIAALWTTPIAWGHLPGVNTRLEIESERMVGDTFRVRWKAAQEGKKDLAGVFIFEFDEKGRIGRHVIENVEHRTGEEVGKVVTVTEWLMRKARGEGDGEGGLALGCKGEERR